VPAVDEKTKTDEKTYTNDGDLDIGHYNMPSGNNSLLPK
jgi:hypothetical protein